MNEVEYDEVSEVRDLVSEDDARLGYGTFFVTLDESEGNFWASTSSSLNGTIMIAASMYRELYAMHCANPFPWITLFNPQKSSMS